MILENNEDVFCTGNEMLDRQLKAKLPEYENKIKLLGDKTEVISHTHESIQKFKEFRYYPNGYFNDMSKSVKILVPDDFFECNGINNLKFSIENYNKLAPTYKSRLKEIIIPTYINGPSGYFLHTRPNTIFVFEESIDYNLIFGKHTFVHEATHLIDGISHTISNGTFKNVFYNNAKETLSNNLYNKFQTVTENRLGYDSFNFLEKRKIKKLFNSNNGRDSWRDYINQKTDFHGTAFSEELADSVGVTITGTIRDRTVNDGIISWILNNLWI